MKINKHIINLIKNYENTYLKIIFKILLQVINQFMNNNY